MTNRSRGTAFFSILMVVSMIIWGGSWVSAKAVAGNLPIETLSFWRFFLTFICFIPLVLLFRVPGKMTRFAAGYILLGSVSMGVYTYLFFRGLREGYAGAAGVLVTSTIPLATLVLSVPFFKQRFVRRDYIGLILGIAGGAVILNVWTLDTEKIFMGGNIYLLLCPGLWALVTISSQKAGRLTSPVIFSFFTYGVCTIMFFFLALPHGITAVFQQGWPFWLNMVYLAVISSTLATTVYFYASSRLDSYRASSFVFLVPFSALMLSWIFLGEAPKPATIAGGIIAVAATYVINKKQ